MMLEDADAHSSVTFVSVACSGAGLKTGILEGYSGQSRRGRISSRRRSTRWSRRSTCAAARRASSTPVLIQAGANDIGFGDLVRPLRRSPHQPLLRHQRLARLHRPVGGKQPGGPPRALPQGPRDDGPEALVPAGERVSSPSTPIPSTAPPAPRISAKSSSPTPPSASSTATSAHPSRSGRTATSSSAARFACIRQRAIANWHLVGNITDSFLGHGECAADPWFIHFGESRSNQQDESGTLHPNASGHQLYGDRIFSSLRSIMTDFGPQPPAPPPASTATPARRRPRRSPTRSRLPRAVLDPPGRLRGHVWRRQPGRRVLPVPQHLPRLLPRLRRPQLRTGGPGVQVLAAGIRGGSSSTSGARGLDRARFAFATARLRLGGLRREDVGGEVAGGVLGVHRRRGPQVEVRRRDRTPVRPT
jgi:hypothetical protein